VLGIGLILFAAQLTCYYFIIFLGFALLWPWLPRSGTPLALLSFATCEFGLAFPGWDDCYFAISVTYVAFVLALTGAVAWTGRQRAKALPGRAIPLSPSST
jgi:hypothetical protein